MPKFIDEFFSSIAEIEEEVNKFFDHLSSTRNSLPKPSFQEQIWQPDVDVYETTDDVIVICDLAGVKKEEIDVSIQGDELIIQGERKVIKLEKNYVYHQMELQFGPFKRIIKLPTSCSIHQTKAKYKDGLLKIILPKEIKNKK